MPPDDPPTDDERRKLQEKEAQQREQHEERALANRQRVELGIPFARDEFNLAHDKLSLDEHYQQLAQERPVPEPTTLKEAFDMDHLPPAQRAAVKNAIDRIEAMREEIDGNYYQDHHKVFNPMRTVFSALVPNGDKLLQAEEQAKCDAIDVKYEKDKQEIDDLEKREVERLKAQFERERQREIEAQRAREEREKEKEQTRNPDRSRDRDGGRGR